MSELRRPRRAAFSGSTAAGTGGAILLASLLGSCLVTSQVNYEQPLLNATLKQLEPAQEFVTLPVQPDEECERLGLGYMRFQIAISDLNREEDLKMRVVVNKIVAFDVDIPANGKELRELDPPFFCLESRDLMAPCNLVEALVSSSIPSSRRDPYAARDGDLASVHWWVIGNAQDNPNASYLDCPEPGPDAGVP